mgnify:FL=1
MGMEQGGLVHDWLYTPCHTCNPIISLINVPTPALLARPSSWPDVYQPPLPASYLQAQSLQLTYLVSHRQRSSTFPAFYRLSSASSKSCCVICPAQRQALQVAVLSLFVCNFPFRASTSLFQLQVLYLSFTAKRGNTKLTRDFFAGKVSRCISASRINFLVHSAHARRVVVSSSQFSFRFHFVYHHGSFGHYWSTPWSLMDGQRLV